MSDSEQNQLIRYNKNMLWIVQLLMIAAVLDKVNSFRHCGSSLVKVMASRAISMSNEVDASFDANNWIGAKKLATKDSGMQTVLSSEQIAKILPHRYPFLLVDRVVEFERGKRIVGIKCVTANEPQFTGHFPERPIMPGVMMVEAMAQLGNHKSCELLTHSVDNIHVHILEY